VAGGCHVAGKSEAGSQLPLIQNIYGKMLEMVEKIFTEKFLITLEVSFLQEKDYFL
jgi:hypothetical protein